MQKSKIFFLLSRFSDEDLRRFKLFAESPFFNSNRKITALLDFLLPFAPAFDNTALNIRAVCLAVFPDAPERMDAKEAIGKLLSKLLDLAQQFLVHDGIQHEAFIKSQIRLKRYRQLGIDNWNQSALKEMQQQLDEYPFRDEIWASNRYILEKEQASWLANQETFQQNLDLTAYGKALDDFYLRAKLECLCHQKNHSAVTKHEYNFSQNEHLQAVIALQGESVLPVTQLWKAALDLLFKPGDVQLFVQLKSRLLDLEPYLPQPEIRTIYGFLFNTARLTFPRHEDYFKELFALYRLCLHNNALLVDKQISPGLFRNIVTVGLSQGAVTWIAEFVQQYKHLLHTNYPEREDVVKFCDALVAFEQQQYEQALDFLNETRFKDMQHKLNEKRLRLKIYYEMNYIDSLEDAANSFRKFLTVHKTSIPAHHLEANRTFVNLTLSILHLKPFEKTRQQQIAEEIRDNSQIHEKVWLEEKIRVVKILQ